LARLPAKTLELDPRKQILLRDEILEALAESTQKPVPRLVCVMIYKRHGFTDWVAEEQLFRLVCQQLHDGKPYHNLVQENRIAWHIDQAPWTRSAQRRDGTKGPNYGLKVTHCAQLEQAGFMPTDVAATRKIGDALTAENLPTVTVNTGKGVQTILSRITTRRNEFSVEVASIGVAELVGKIAELQAENADIRSERNNWRAAAERNAKMAERALRLMDDRYAPGEDEDAQSSHHRTN
jgi:hypothetical protein